MKTLSCGILVYNANNELLIGHATGQKHWDIPKGSIEPGEEPIDCAIREAHEEFGLVFFPDELADIGEFNYNSAKNLHLFVFRDLNNVVDVDGCKCTSKFTDHRGKEVFEIDAFKWASTEEQEKLLSKSLKRLLFSDTVL